MLNPGDVVLFFNETPDKFSNFNISKFIKLYSRRSTFSPPMQAALCWTVWNWVSFDFRILPLTVSLYSPLVSAIRSITLSEAVLCWSYHFLWSHFRMNAIRNSCNSLFIIADASLWINSAGNELRALSRGQSWDLHSLLRKKRTVEAILLALFLCRRFLRRVLSWKETRLWRPHREEFVELKSDFWMYKGTSIRDDETKCSTFNALISIIWGREAVRDHDDELRHVLWRAAPSQLGGDH